MSAYDLFSLHLTERETAHVDLERRRLVLERLAIERATHADASASGAPASTPARLGGLRGPVGLLRLLPRRA